MIPDKKLSMIIYVIEKRKDSWAKNIRTSITRNGEKKNNNGYTSHKQRNDHARIEPLTHHMRSMMLMMHCMMMSLLLSVMFSMMLAAPVRRVSVIKDKVEARLASLDLRHGHLGRATVQLSRYVVRLHGRHRVWFLVVLRRVFQRYIVLVQIDRERDTMMRWQHFHVWADRRHRGGWIQLHQGCLQFQGIHVAWSRRNNPASRSSKRRDWKWNGESIDLVRTIRRDDPSRISNGCSVRWLIVQISDDVEWKR